MSTLRLPRPYSRHEVVPPSTIDSSSDLPMSSLSPSPSPSPFLSASTSTIPATATSPTTLEARLAASARQQQLKLHARLKRAEHKSPFVPKKHQQAGGIVSVSHKGKEKDLSDLLEHELAEMLRVNASLLESKSTMSLLPGSSDSKIRQQQDRLEARLKEIQDINRIREDLQKTRLEGNEDHDDDTLLDIDDDQVTGAAGAKAEEDIKPRIGAGGVGDPSSSPAHPTVIGFSPLTVKRRLALRAEVQQAATRERLATERRLQESKRKDEMRNQKVGNRLKGAFMKGGAGQGAAFANFMSHADSDDDDEPDEEDDDDDPLLDAQEEMLKIQQGQLDEEEDRELNPYSHAYHMGRSRAIAEEKGLAKGADVDADPIIDVGMQL
ncbi:BQ5605_C002g01006 [Microbotryum silenes-dioicae]|uniref:BQ5605_C002g01006 protein n=1 Tax=Microbotryum silenes-dioicae TaxID=796604 RepID=A0A2X0LXF8_9BASI|nr:BQ5605_C002g01006 [Microbotryum silenes-dioicae]